jgi:hypothetical protein
MTGDLWGTQTAASQEKGNIKTEARRLCLHKRPLKINNN